MFSRRVSVKVSFWVVASFVAFAPVAMSDSEAERLVLEQDMQDHAARQPMRPIPRQPAVPVLPLSNKPKLNQT